MLGSLCLSLSILWAFFFCPSCVSLILLCGGFHCLLCESRADLMWLCLLHCLVGRPPSNSPRGGYRLFRESQASPIWLCLQMPGVAAVKIRYGVVQNLNSPTPNVLDPKAGALTRVGSSSWLLRGWAFSPIFVAFLGSFGGFEVNFVF